MPRHATMEYNLAKMHPAIAEQWHPTKNLPLTPSDVMPGSNKKVWWICSKNQDHEWESLINNRTSRTNGTGCPYCSGNRVGEDNNLAVRYPEIAKQWHLTKNGTLTPYDVMPASNKRAWWICERGHEWQAIPAKRTGRGYGCPYCSGHRVGQDNNLAARYPEIAKQWHPTKNGTLTANDVMPGSHEKAWWICDKGHVYESVIKDRTNVAGCRECYRQNAAENLRRATRTRRERLAAKDTGVTKLESFGSQSGGNS